MAVDLPKPPYNYTTLHIPLTATERTRMHSWLAAVAKAGGINLNPSVHASDDELLSDYKAVVNNYHLTASGAPKITDPGSAIVGGIEGSVHTVEQFFEWISSPQTWVRIGEIVAGLVLLKVGVSAALGQSVGQSASGSAKTFWKHADPMKPFRE